MLLCKKIKLNVTEQDAATLEFMQGKCLGLYNWWVMRLREGEKWPGWRIAKQTLQDLEHGKETVGLGIALRAATQLGVALFIAPGADRELIRRRVLSNS